MLTAKPLTAAASSVTEVLDAQPAELRQGEPSTSGRADHAAQHPSIARAAATLSAGEVVAIPTETVYGLAANALSAEAVGRVYAAKNRPADNPLIIHISSLEMLASLYPPGWSLPPVYEPLVRDLWPGPLTILVPRSPLVPDAVTCGLPTMAVRMPAHPVALAVIAACGFPLAAPSANSSGRPSPTIARHVFADLGGRIPLIIDGGPCTCGVESTVLDGLRSPPAILRPGGVTREQLLGYPGLGALQVYRRDFVDAALEAAPTTPGMKYRHYSPTAPVLLLDPNPQPPTAASSSNGHQPSLSAGQRHQQAGQHSGTAATAAEVEAPAADLAARLRHGAEALLAELAAAEPPAASDTADGGGARRFALLRTSLDDVASGPQAPSAGSAPGGHANGNGQATDAAPAPALPYEVYEYVLGHVSRPADVAAELFAALRHVDEQGVEAIVVEGVQEGGAGAAVMNRLRKAASRVVHV
ncbi:hypothetical protein HYH03_011182 [Edaphochlamys debaryana]|uniref:Threonylcarbamoyl-AMP synthase n=1 Tax=Edaphochlamys debaryana TaxID=47281 RepID=A0A835XUJ1_9CHLO|nr:hypothetical protein HYH03_011182 [Edaphochlamys debaryana]|eukprot:KAG2490381.1 hypothetical protein HYH03_011182 [Edaphochlamys debaryana]